MKHIIVLICLSLFTLPVDAQVTTSTAGRIQRVTTDPAGGTCTPSDVRVYNGAIYSCQSGVFALSGAASIASATATVEGKQILGDTDVVAIASLGTCAAGNAGQIKYVSDGNKGPRTCGLSFGSTYAWIDHDPVIRVSRFGVTSSASAADNVTNIAVALTAAAAGYPVVIFDEGTYSFNSEIYVPAGVTIRGQGADKTILNYTKATGSLFRATDYAVNQQYNRFENFRINATGSAVNANTTGIDLSSMSHAVIDQARIYNFGTQILLDGHRSGPLVSTYYNNIYDTFVGMGSAGNVFTSRGIAIQGGANSNHITRPSFSYLTYPIILGDSANEAANQIVIDDPVIEEWEGTAVQILKAIGLIINYGRYEGNGSNNTVFYAADSTADVNGVTLNKPYLEPTGTITVLNSKNPTVFLEAGNYRSFVSRRTGISSDVGNNLIQNGGFEGYPPSINYPLLGWFNLNLTNWSHGTIYVSRESSIVKSGTYSIRIGNTVDTGIGLRSSTVSVDATRPYTLDWWSYGTTTTVGYRPMFKLFDSAGAEITTGSNISFEGVGENAAGGTSGLSYSATYAAWILGGDITHSSATTWTRQSYAFSFPSGTVTAQIGFALLTTPLQYVYLDNLQLVQGQASTAFMQRKLDDSGDQSFHGNLTAPRFTTSDPYQGGSGFYMGLTGLEGQLKHPTSRINFDAYNHVFRRENSTTGMMRLSETGVLSFGSTVFSEDIGIKRNAAGVLEFNSGTGGTYRDWIARNGTLSGGTLTLTNANVTATSGGTTTLDLSLGNIRTVTMPAGNTTLALSNVPVGVVDLAVIQDGTGGRTITFPSTIKNGTSTLTLQPSPAASSRTQYRFQCDGTNCQLAGYQSSGGPVLLCAGTATLSSGTVTVTNSCVRTPGTNSIIQLTPSGSSTGVVRVSTTTANTSFVITSTDAGSSDSVYWSVFGIN